MRHPPRPFPRFLVLAVLTVVVLAPFLAARIPAFGDTLNHLARMHILATIGHSPDLQRFYAVQWQPIPYLAMDAIVPLLARIVPIYVAGKIFVCACLLMPAAAAATLHYAIHRRISLVPAAGLLLCTNYLLALGFLNYLFMSGLAVMLFAAWLRTEPWPRWPRTALFALPLVLLYLGHAFAALAYCLCVAGAQTARALRAGPAAWRASLADMLAAAAQALPALGLAATLHVGGGYVGTLNTDYGNIAVKLFALLSPALLLADPVFLLTALASIGLAWALRRHIRLSPAIWPSCVSVGLVAIAMPHVVASTWGMDLRLPLIVAMLLVGGASLPAAAAWRVPALIALAGMIGVRSIDAWFALARIDRQIADTRGLLARMPSGARLLVVNTAGHGTGFERITANTEWHMPLVAVIDRDAFVPYLFNGLTTVHVQPRYRLSSTPNGLPISPEQLREGASVPDDGTEHGDGFGARLYYRGWPDKFDYVLVQHPDAPIPALPDRLTPIAAAPDLDLFAVHR